MKKSPIKNAAVLGAGVMGAQLSGLFANKGIKTYLFDISIELASSGRDRLKTIKPAPLENPENIDLIIPCCYDTDMEKIIEADWVLEAIAEDLDIKLNLYDRLIPFLKDSAILTTNTSGITQKELSQNFSLDLKNRFMLTHFFNPPRYMRLLELVKGENTSTETYNTISNFGKDVLEKGIVPAKDTPNFIGNRVGVFGLMSTINIAMEMGMNIETVDALTGTICGRPKSATFRTADVIGLDVLKNVAMTTYQKSNNDESVKMFNIPETMSFLIQKGNLGQKTKAGFYKKDENGNILVLDLDSRTYRPIEKIDIELDSHIIQSGTINQRINALINLDSKNGEFFWEILSQMLLYCANRVPEISDNINDIDNAMKWGFGWEVGPFEIWEMIGLSKSIKRMNSENKLVPNWVIALLEQEKNIFIRSEINNKKYYRT
jgi:3-hydroxyacyl-CoA dehydrogenase